MKLFDRIRFVFLTREVHVKPAMPNVGADLFGWLTVEQTVIEALRDEVPRYGLRIAYLNFVYSTKCRWAMYSHKQRARQLG